MKVLAGDCLAVLPMLEADSFDSCVTDPPYHLVSISERFGPGQKPAGDVPDGRYGRLSRGFMGKQWDGGDVSARPETWTAVYRVLKPGAHLVAFGGTRTYHRMACAIEDAGFEIRDCIQWLYGSGFPKSHDVSKGIDRAAGVERLLTKPGTVKRNGYGDDWDIGSSDTRPRYDDAATDAARQWQGWGTALKPACEPIVLARKPLSEGTVAANVLRWGTGALNIGACRIATDESTLRVLQDIRGGNYAGGNGGGRLDRIGGGTIGRWPANVVHDGSDEVVQGFPDDCPSGGGNKRQTKPSAFNASLGRDAEVFGPSIGGDTGSAARFFYTAKADGDERIGSKHPTVKPLDLMQWLIRLVTPKGGLVLDPFAGTGTTGEAAWREGCRATLIEREAEYLADIARRMELMKAGPNERAREIVKASGKAQGHEDLPLFNRQWADMWAKPFDKPELVWGKK